MGERGTETETKRRFEVYSTHLNAGREDDLSIFRGWQSQLYIPFNNLFNMLIAF